MELIFITRVQKILRSSRKQASFKKGDRHDILVCVVYFSNNKFPYDVGVETGKQFFGTLNLFKWLKNAPRSIPTIVQNRVNPRGFHKKSANTIHKKSATRVAVTGILSLFARASPTHNHPIMPHSKTKGCRL
jgi:hypothetical protein